MKVCHLTWLGLVLGLTACSEAPGYISLGTNAADYGYIDHGERWGVMIGASHEAAKNGLARYDGRFLTSGICDAKMQETVACQSGDAFDMYLEEILPKVRLFTLFYRGGTVTGLRWEMESAEPWEQL